MRCGVTSPRHSHRLGNSLPGLWLGLVPVRTQLSVTRIMAERVLETDFPLIAPPNPPLSVHPRIVTSGEAGRNGSLRRAYSEVSEVTEVTPLQAPARSPDAPGVESDQGDQGDQGSETSDYLSDSTGPPGYTTLPQKDTRHKTYAANSLTHGSFRPPTQRHLGAHWTELPSPSLCSEPTKHH